MKIKDIKGEDPEEIKLRTKIEKETSLKFQGEKQDVSV